jgi:hypothetical protein
VDAMERGEDPEGLGGDDFGGGDDDFESD